VHFAHWSARHDFWASRAELKVAGAAAEPDDDVDDDDDDEAAAAAPPKGRRTAPGGSRASLKKPASAGDAAATSSNKAPPKKGDRAGADAEPTATASWLSGKKRPRGDDDDAASQHADGPNNTKNHGESSPPEGDATKEPPAAQENEEKKKAIKLPLPRELKAQLVLDWEQITLEPRKWVPLPRTPTVAGILDEFVATRVQHARHARRWRDFADAVALYFDKALPKILLYRYEREQFDLVQRKLSATRPSRFFGGEHLLRLFAKLPELMAQSDLSPSEVTQARQKLTEMFKFLVAHRSRFFLPHYQLRETLLGNGGLDDVGVSGGASEGVDRDDTADGKKPPLSSPDDAPLTKSAAPLVAASSSSNGGDHHHQQGASDAAADAEGGGPDDSVVEPQQRDPSSPAADQAAV